MSDPPEAPKGRLVRDPLNGAWTVIASRRQARPHDPADSGFPAADRATPGPGGAAAATDCPFCEGHEHLTPPEVDALRPAGSAPDTPGWSVRVVPNKFPVFEGGHEVVVHSPRHDLPLYAQPPANGQGQTTTGTGGALLPPANNGQGQGQGHEGHHGGRHG